MAMALQSRTHTCPHIYEECRIGAPEVASARLLSLFVHKKLGTPHIPPRANLTARTSPAARYVHSKCGVAAAAAFLLDMQASASAPSSRQLPLLSPASRPLRQQQPGGMMMWHSLLLTRRAAVRLLLQPQPIAGGLPFMAARYLRLNRATTHLPCARWPVHAWIPVDGPLSDTSVWPYCEAGLSIIPTCLGLIPFFLLIQGGLSRPVAHTTSKSRSRRRAEDALGSYS